MKKNSTNASARTVTLLFIVILSLAGAAFAGEPLAEDEKKELYSQGQELFRQATEVSAANPEKAEDLYAKALLRFNRLVKEGGIQNGKLFYNIGNINFLLQDTGRAILNYRRAEQFIPNDPNLVKNLAYARNMRQDKLEIKDQRKIQQTLLFFHYDFGTRTRLVLFGISYLLFWIFAGLKILSRRTYTSWVFSISLCFTLLFGTSLYIEGLQSNTSLEGVILDSEVIARQGDADSYQPSFEDPLHGGTEFMLLEDRGVWWQIELSDGRSCWIPEKSGELVRLDY